MASPYLIGVLPGEGIGPEVINATLPLLSTIESMTSIRFSIEIGGKIGLEAKKDEGKVLTETVIDFCKNIFSKQGAVFCGPGGGSFVYQLRKELDLFCKFMPILPFQALRDEGVLKLEAVENADIMVIRENLGGLYQGEGGFENTHGVTHAYQNFSYTDRQVKRILDVAVKAASRRRNKLCVVHKPGGVQAISKLWSDIAEKSIMNTDIELCFLEVDTASYMLLADAKKFDVVVTPNMFGDIIGDCSALLLASRGMSYSANFSDHGVAVYQTAHGAAYDIAGLNIANPLGQIQSLAMLLKENFGLDSIASQVMAAVNIVLENGYRTADIKGFPHQTAKSILGTKEMGEVVAQQLKLQLSDSHLEKGREANQLISTKTV